MVLCPVSSQPVNQALPCKTYWPQFHKPPGWLRTKHHCWGVVMQRLSLVEILHFHFWLFLYFHLDWHHPPTCWGSDMTFVSVETIQSQLWIFVFFFFTNLLASPGKWESVFSFSSTAKTTHLDKSFSVMLSFKFLFLQKTGRQKLPEGWGHFFTKANSLVWAIFRWYYLDTSGVMSSLFDKVFTCLRTFLDLRQEPVKLSHIFTFIQGRWSLR